MSCDEPNGMYASKIMTATDEVAIRILQESMLSPMTREWNRSTPSEKMAGDRSPSLFIDIRFCAGDI
tara:strand:+ start:3859 stop:4059 length:201 start_codon:yes stop_codon:yes gene_type:complete